MLETDMAGNGKGGRSVTATLNPEHQNLESLQKLLAQIAGRGGCDRCGRIAFLHVDFLGDPPPEIAHQGVISFTEGFAAQ
jgi:hypothetical protein